MTENRKTKQQLTENNPSDRDLALVRYKNRKESIKIIEQITEASIEYVENQVKNGIQCFQLFETYCGSIPHDLYTELILPFSKKILNSSKKLNCPTIFFPKDYSFGLKNINAGYEIPEKSIGPFNQNDLVKYAKASGDFNPIHLDKEFAKTMDATTSNYGSMVLDNTSRSNEIQDCVYWYRAEVDIPEFQLGKRIFWKLDQKCKKDEKIEDFDFGPVESDKTQKRITTVQTANELGEVIRS